jgi:DNA-binding NarL/FixJ family response regulator
VGIFDKLTNQEQTVLALVAQGKRNAVIAHELTISIRTVETHLYRIFNKLGVSSRTEAALQVMRPETFSSADVSGISDDSGSKNRYSGM